MITDKMAKAARRSEKKNVRFNLAISNEKEPFNPNEDHVFLVFKDKENEQFELLPFLSENEGVYKLSCTLEIPSDEITNDRYLAYSYELHRKHGAFEKEERAKGCLTRTLTIPEKNKDDNWCQHDGFFEHKYGMLETMKNWWNELDFQHIGTYMWLFFPDLKYKERNGFSNFLKQLRMLLHGLRKIYLIEGHYWKDEEEFKRFASKQCVDIISKVHKQKRDQGYTTVFSLSMLLALYHTKFDVFYDTERERLSNYVKTTAVVESQTCPEIEAIDQYFKKEKKGSFKQAILKLARGTLQSTQRHSFLTWMPWIHFLSGDCKPYERIPFDMRHDHSEPRWWGVTSVKDLLDAAKDNKWDMSHFKDKKKMSALFKMDYLLPRSILAATGLKDLNGMIQTRLFPVEVCLANIIYHIKNADHRKCDLLQCMDSLLKNIDNICSKSNSLEVETEMSYKMATQLVMECLKTYSCEEKAMSSSAQLFLTCVIQFEKCTTDRALPESKRHEVAEDVNKICSKIIEWMKKMNPRSLSDKENYLKVWTSLHKQDTKSDILRSYWNTELSVQLAKTFGTYLSSKQDMSWFVKYYCKNYDTFNQDMQKQLGNVAFEAVKKLDALEYKAFAGKGRTILGELLSKLFLSEWQKFGEESNNDEHMIVKFLLNWSAFSVYLKIFLADKTFKKMLSDDCISKVALAASKIENLAETLLEGTLTVDNLYLIMEKKKIFLELINLLPKKVSSKLISNAITVRQNEIDAFMEYMKQVSNLSTMCQSLSEGCTVSSLFSRNLILASRRRQNSRTRQKCVPTTPAVLLTSRTSFWRLLKNGVDKTELDLLMRCQPKIGQFKIGDLCQVQRIDEDTRKDIPCLHPKMIDFVDSQKIGGILPEFCRCCSSITFVDMWHMKCREVGDSCKTFDDVWTNIWNAVNESFELLRKQIETGDMTFKEFDRLFCDKYRDDYKSMKGDLQKMMLEADVIDTRIDQLQNFQQLQTCKFGLNSILQFVQQYELTGDFELVKTIASHKKFDMKMKGFDDISILVCENLRDLTREQANCLQAFVDCKKLISWLKESMENSGLKELNVFVDLALMSAGEEPMNIARVQCLHTAVTGYAPLIFDLQKDAGFEELLLLCKCVWKELDANPSLPDKLIDTARHLQWLDTIQKAHGSVEITSMMQVEACNDCGEYTIGSNVWPNRVALDDKKSAMLVQDVLKLTVPGDKEGKRETRNYNTEHLQDLQSRLMLVSGNSETGAERVEKFTMIFDGALRLSNVYVRLCSAGCVLFKDWSACFFCDPESPVCAIVEFGESDCQLKGRQSKTEELMDIIPKLAGFMESCFDKWMDFIKEKRKQYHHLNFFTTDQLVILQRELVKIGTNKEPSHLIYPLLSAVKRDCSRVDLQDAMTKARNELDDVEQAQLGESEADDGESEDCGHEEVISFIQLLTEQGFSESLARKAFKKVGPDASEGFEWCMENADEDSEENELFEESPSVLNDTSPTPLFTKWNESGDSFLNVMTSRIKSMKKQGGTGSAPLLSDLTLIWQEFLDSISSNIEDYLSLEHLGLILKHLDTIEVKMDRKFPPNFEESIPNLIVCRLGEVLPTTLSIYIYDKDQPLPSSDETLLCTNTTSTDEIDIFFRRALFDNGRKIHCLVNADSLRYDVSEQAENLLEDYLVESKCQDVKYKLVVICSLENEYRSTLVTFLDKYKRTSLPIKINIIRTYLKDKLVCRLDNIDGIKPASAVDKERLTVRVVKSWRAGVGKSLYKDRRAEDLQTLNDDNVVSTCVSIPLQDKSVNTHYVVQRLLEHARKTDEKRSTLFHIDIFHEVLEGVDGFLFNLLILGYLTDETGFVWRKRNTDIYLIETLPFMQKETYYLHNMLDILPEMTCRSPKESLDLLKTNRLSDNDQLFDKKKCMDDIYQRPYQYLVHLDNRSSGDIIYDPAKEKGSEKEVLRTILSHCGLQNPSWAELFYFVNFLNKQLMSFESNIFVSDALARDLPGFGRFVLRFLIHMSRDFSTHSLEISERTPEMFGHEKEASDPDNLDEFDELRQFQMRRTWESSPHPYLFFNEDKTTFTFLGFHIDKRTRNVIDQQTKAVLEKNIMTRHLYAALEGNGVPLNEDFDNCTRQEKIQRLRNVMGINETHDPDETYELTTDNVKKMMAIHMRFRCDIPVIVMGETGCGKTRLVKFLCDLQIPPGSSTQNMIVMKVHGGTSKKDIKRKVEQAQQIAAKNMQVNKNTFTVLFFDEANTTESVGLIKEIMCDKTLEGKKMELCENLKMVAACNPYRKHPDEFIKKLEQAGLGYHVDAKQTSDRLGRVPMRQLVYRVQPLPQSLLPLVWDFGQLSTQVEKLYIKQMVRRYISTKKIPDTAYIEEVISNILTESQNYMRQQRDECSFVSLRDVDRTLTVMSWFYEESLKNDLLFTSIDKKIGDKLQKKYTLDRTTRSLVLALGVCYHASIRPRKEYRDRIAKFFVKPCGLENGGKQIGQEIDSCQEVYLDNVRLDETIACNTALKENVFMMVVCVELRLPLFLVGKPGSSKSLAKTIVSDAMQGNAAKYDIFKRLKHVQMVSFQCSPLSTPEGIVGTFKQCAQFQEDKDLNSFVSVVVLDEVGLAEDSPRMPLKTLHPLLEDGCQGDEEAQAYKKVAFIGISNWALDPAKMNRGILVQREVPDIQELKMTASGICKTSKQLESLIEPLIEPMAVSYLDVFNKASEEMREFFGLRDFYSLVKMVFAFVDKSKQRPTWHEMVHSVKRNFDGLQTVDPVERFESHLTRVMHIEKEPKETDPDCSTAGLIHACLFDTNNMNRESRYLLLITETYGALSIIQQQILAGGIQNRPITIFGSSFPSDQEYTQVCRNINKIKLCMEAGKTVLLLNLENLYESLYDALNQYYVYFGGDRYVDLGLGTHRVKCTVHKNFRLIVVAEKKTVYKVFPIPLINRLEKHFMNINTMLTDTQQELASKLKDWTHVVSGQSGLSVSENFVGYHEDVCSSVILYTWEANANADITDYHSELAEKTFEDAKATLLLCTTPDAVFRLNKSDLPFDEQKILTKLYFQDQSHGSFLDYIEKEIVTNQTKQLFSQVTTHSKLLGHVHKQDISQASGVEKSQILLIESLSSFDTEQQFTGKMQHFLKACKEKPTLVIIQCENGHSNANLIACARFCALDVFEKLRDEIDNPVHIIFIVHLPRIAGGCFAGFQCGIWKSIHIDDLYPEDRNLPVLFEMQGRSVAQLFEDAVNRCTPKEDEKFESVSLSRMEGLVCKCVQAALANVKDIEENKKREQMRVKIVMELIFAANTKETVSFLYGVCRVIAMLLSEKERSTQSFIDPKDWMAKEATSSDKISEAGTFRRSCLKILEGKVSPILAGVIAFLDTNQNLDILSTEASKWKTDLWQHILCTPNALEFSYSELQSPTRTSELREALVLYTGSGKKVFESQMPFSWLYISKISDIYIETNKRTDDTDTVYQGMVGLLKEMPLCRLLYDIDNENSVLEGIRDYINDFVCSVYHNGSKNEQNVLCEALEGKAFKFYRTYGEFTLLNAVVCVHIVYNKMTEGLSYFRLINIIWIDCSSQILELKVNNPEHSILKDNDITMAAAYLLCEHTSPDKLDGTLSRAKSKVDDYAKRAEWLGKVQHNRPVLEKTLYFLEKQAQSSDFPSDNIKHIRCQWERIIVMKLFIEHICLTSEEKTYINYCMPLWKQLCKLGHAVNMEMVEPIKKVEEFMKLINKKHVKDLLGDVSKCSQCERMLDTVPVKLPCGDLICKGCFQGLKTRNRKCFTCKNVFAEDWEPTTGNQNLKEKEIAILKGYQKKCNAFFMDMISQLCFTDDSAPSVKVIEKLLSFITFDGSKESGVIQTKVMSIFDTGIDPTPVFRSFLLQLLLKTSMDDVKKNIDVYLTNADNIIKMQDKENTAMASDQNMDNISQYIELCLMIIQCLEDIFTEEASKAESEIDYATEALQCVASNLTKDELSVNKLVTIAKARVGLAICAKYQNGALNTSPKIQMDVHDLLSASRMVCSDECKWPRIFIVKIISRCYGLDNYFKLCSSEDDLLNWVSLPQAKVDVRVASDRYLVCGGGYLRLRRAVTDVALGKEVNHLENIIKELGVEELKTAVYLDLALYREIACANLFPDDGRPFPMKKIAVFEEFLSKTYKNIHSCHQRKDLPLILLQNAILPEQLQVEGQLDVSTQGIQCLLVHFLSILNKLDGNKTLLQPFTCLIVNAELYKDAFLPTMPQDDLDGFRALLLQDIDKEDKRYKETKLYKCPNGHIYIVANCGNPRVSSKCLDCGAEIGRIKGNRNAIKSRRDNNFDETKPGHILGPPEKREKKSLPERELTPNFCACVRLLLHMSLYLGSANNLEVIHSMIKPKICKDDVSTYLWNHIKVDIENLENGTGKSMDDVLLLLHVLIDNIMEIHIKGDGVTADDKILQLKTKVDRKNWEIKFVTTYLQGTFNQIEDLLNVWNEKLAADDRLGGNPLLCLMHETQNMQDESENHQRLHEVSRAWRFRTPISLEHLRNELADKEVADENKILRLFLKEEHHLRALRFVPNILLLQRALLKSFQRKLDRSEGTKITLEEIVHGNTAGPETESMVKEFSQAWDLVRLSLKEHVCRTDTGGVVVPEHLCNMQVTDKTPVSVLLPSTKGLGLCSFALLDFLLRKVQNGFLDNYLRETKRKYSSFLSVKPKELTSAHLICYDPHQDLLSLILANCQYSFEMGKGTTVEYDFNGLERQIIDRFLLSKSRIDVGPVLQIDMMVYRTEVTNSKVFKELAEKIKQSPLSAAVKTQVSGEIKSYTDICDSLVNMDIVISFLKSTGGKQDQNLHTFMSDILRMGTSIASRTAQQVCEFQHCKSMWLHLSLLKSKMMVDNNKAMSSIFESVQASYHNNLTPEIGKELVTLLREYTVEKLTPFVEILHEYILIHLAVEDNTNDEDYMDIKDKLLRDYLYVYIEELDIEEDTDIVLDLPPVVLNMHSLPLWILAYNVLREKQTGDRRV